MNDEDVDRLLIAAAGAGHGAPDVHTDDAVLVRLRAGTLAPDEAAAAEAHLAECRACRDLLAGLARPPDARQLARAQEALNARAEGRGVRRRVIALALGAAAAVAAALVFASLPGEPAPPVYRVTAFEGMVVEVRGGAPEREPRFHPDSPLRWVLKPTRDLEGPPPPYAVLAAHEDGALERVPAEAVHAGTGGAVRVEAAARVLFGDRFGRWRLCFAAARDARAQEAIEGTRPSGGEPRGMRWICQTLVYAPVDVEMEDDR